MKIITLIHTVTWIILFVALIFFRNYNVLYNLLPVVGLVLTYITWRSMDLETRSLTVDRFCSFVYSVMLLPLVLLNELTRNGVDNFLFVITSFLIFLNIVISIWHYFHTGYGDRNSDGDGDGDGDD